MSIPVECEECYASLNAKDEHAGRRIKCPECGGPIEVPGRSRRQPSSRQTSGRRPASRSGGRRKSSRSSNEKPPWFWAAVGGGGLAAVLLVGWVAYSMGQADTDTTSSETVASTPSSETSPSEETVAAAPDSANATPETSTTPQPEVDPSTRPVVNAANVTQTSATADSTTPTPIPTTTTPSTTTPSTSTPIPTESTSPAKTFESLADLVEVVEPSVVRIDVAMTGGGGSGSGFVVNAQEQLVITNRHVMEGALKATVMFEGSSEKFNVTHFREPDVARDICVIKIDCPVEKLRTLALAKKIPRKGEDLVAFGAPLGLDFTATKGIMSATRSGKDLAELIGATGHTGTWVQHSVPTSPGNSGGPLVNMQGEVVAVNTMILLEGQNLNFAISSLDVAEVLARQTPLKELRPGAIPMLRKSARPQVIDIAGTEQAEEYLGKIKSMGRLEVQAGRFDPTGRVTATIRSDLQDEVRKTGIKLTGSPTAESFMLAGIVIEDSSGAAGAKSVRIVTVIFYRDLSKRIPQVYKIWEQDEKVGTTSLDWFYRGQVPPRLKTSIKSYFRKLSGAINRAKRDSKDKTKT